jgi:hypothetical protein
MADYFWIHVVLFLFLYFKFACMKAKVNQIKRNVCCLDIENGGGMSMVNLDSYIDSGRIKFIYVLLMNQLKAIGKYWLSIHFF